MENELLFIINKQLDAAFPVSISPDELQHRLSVFINDLIQHDFQKLINILYKADVDELKLKKILRENIGEDASAIIAKLIIERELQKISTRKQFKVDERGF